jgi:hypothetical protein
VVLGRSFPTTTPQYVSLVRIVPGALLFVGKDLVRGLDLGEEGGGAFGVAMVAVGMELERLFAVRFLESGVVRRGLLYVYVCAVTYSSCVAVLSTPSSS